MGGHIDPSQGRIELIYKNHKIGPWKKMFHKATAKFDSHKIFVEFVTMKINYREILGKISNTNNLSHANYRKNDLRKSIPAKISSLKVGTSNERKSNNIVI